MDSSHFTFSCHTTIQEAVYMNLNLFFQIQISKNFEVEIALLILGEGLRW